MTPRRRARDLVLRALFQMDVGGAELEQALEDVLRDPGGPVDTRYVEEVTRGVKEHQESLDRFIEGQARHWTLERMGRVDRNLLRMGVYELLYRSDVPPAVAIAEAVRMAKIYGDDRSGRFVNGLLDAIRSAPSGGSR